MTSKIVYEGQLRTVMTHVESGTEVTTAAPKDNHGLGDAFSPTDLVATALGSCMISIMGIYAKNNDIDIVGTTAEITKVMASNPRRIAQIIVDIKMPFKEYSEKEKNALENAALTCPVAKSLHPDIEQDVSFEWSEQD
jgi:putative redox protein